MASLKQSKKIRKLIDSFNGISKRTVWVMEQCYNCCSLPGISFFRLAQLTLREEQVKDVAKKALVCGEEKPPQNYHLL